jgi:hypothetical protein
MDVPAQIKKPQASQFPGVSGFRKLEICFQKQIEPKGSFLPADRQIPLNHSAHMGATLGTEQERKPYLFPRTG